MGSYPGKSRYELRQVVKDRMKHERRLEAKQEIKNQLNELKQRKTKSS